MAGGAADDGAQGDDGVILAALGHLGGDEGDLKGAGDPGHGNVVRPDAVAQQHVLAAAQQLGDNEFVETGADDAHLDALGYQFAFIQFHSDFLL